MHYVPPASVRIPVDQKTLKGLLLLAAWLATKDAPKGKSR